MSEINNIPAFPTNVVNEYHPHEHGMTLLDYFAGQAMNHLFEFYKNDDSMSDEDVAECCYNIAKCMLIERQKHISK